MCLEGKIVKTAIELVKDKNVQDKAVNVFGMLFPFVGVKKKAVDMYIEEIEKSDLPLDIKMKLLLNAKKDFKHYKNQDKIVEIAITNAKDGTDFGESSGVNEEWLDRFMNSAKYVSSEDMQLIWGKILANEFEHPGSTPPNMIRILSEITSELGQAFRKICSMNIWICPLLNEKEIEMSFGKIFVPFTGNEEEFSNIGITFKILNELESIGLIKLSTLAGYVSKNINNKEIIICTNDKLDLIVEHCGDDIPIGNVLLTSVGEALRDITVFEEIPNYYEMVKKYLTDYGIKFASEHNFTLIKKDNELSITYSK